MLAHQTEPYLTHGDRLLPRYLVLSIRSLSLQTALPSGDNLWEFFRLILTGRAAVRKEAYLGRSDMLISRLIPNKRTRKLEVVISIL